MRTVNYVPFTDLIVYATTIGYDWNQACDFMNSLRPQYEMHTHEFSSSDFWIGHEKNDHEKTSEPIPRCSYRATDDAIKVMISFFKTHAVDNIMVADD
jgi:hypothetical protein